MTGRPKELACTPAHTTEQNAKRATAERIGRNTNRSGRFEVREAHPDPRRLRSANFAPDQRSECTTLTQTGKELKLYSEACLLPSPRAPVNENRKAGAHRIEHPLRPPSLIPPRPTRLGSPERPACGAPAARIRTKPTRSSARCATAPWPEPARAEAAVGPTARCA